MGSSLWHAGSFVAVCGLLSSCGAQALWLWHAGSRVCRHSSCGVLVALRHVDLSSLTRDQTRVPCIGRRILNPWTTREVP